MEVDWQTVPIHPGDLNLARRILNFSTDRHVAGWSGRRLAPLLHDCGLTQVCVEPVVIVDEGMHGPEWLGFVPQRADMAAAAGAISSAEAASWSEEIDQAAARHRYFFSVTQFVVRGEFAQA